MTYFVWLEFPDAIFVNAQAASNYRKRTSLFFSNDYFILLEFENVEVLIIQQILEQFQQ